MKTLSFIIPSYNCRQFLDRCLGSFLNPEVLEELDIIVVNDGSRDDTPLLAQSWCDRYPNSIRLISQENKGHGGALNTGCAAARGRYLKVIDADDWVETENLTAFVSFLRTCDSDVVLTHHYTRDISSGEVKGWKTYPEAFGVPYTFGQIMPRWKDFSRSLTFHGITYRTAFYQSRAMALSEHVFYEDHEFATFACCQAKSVTPLDLYIYDYRIGDVAQSVSQENQLRRLGHTETVLRRFLTEYPRLPLAGEDPGRSYFAWKARDLLLSYVTTVLLVEPDRKKGRALARDMVRLFREALPEGYAMARKQYEIFCLMNRLGLRRAHWDALHTSGLYRRLRRDHHFE